MHLHRHLTPLLLATLLSACGGGAPTPEKGAKEEAIAEVKPVAFKLTGKAQGLDFTVTAVTTPDRIGMAPADLKAEASETFVVVSYTLKNTGTSTLGLTERPTLSLLDGSGQTYAPDDSASLMAAGMMDDMSGMAADLNSNVSAKSKAAWKVDKAAFDRGTWKLLVASDPQLTFALK